MTMRLVAGVAVVAALLSGCSEKQEASHTLPTTAAAESQAALPPLGPADMPMPVEARTKDAAGAEALLRYYLNLVNRTSTVMDASPLRELSNGCGECDRLAANVENDAAAGKHYKGGEITVKELGPPLMKETTAEFPFVVDQAELTVVDAAGRAVGGGSQAYADVNAGAAMEWDDARRSWVMISLTFG